MSVSHVFQDSNNSLFVISWLCLYQDLLTLQTNSVSVDGKVEKGWQASWKSLSFKIKIQRLENPWKLQSVLESLWISVLNLSNPDSQMPTRSKHWKTGQNCWHCKRAKKKTHTQGFFNIEWSRWKMWNVSAWNSSKGPWIFCSKKGTNPVNNVKMFPITLSRKCPCGVPIY